MRTTYKNEQVTLQRDARLGDEGFEAGKDQVIIVYDDQHQETVNRSDLGKPAVKAPIPLPSPLKKMPSLPAIAHKKAKTQHKNSKSHRR